MQLKVDLNFLRALSSRLKQTDITLEQQISEMQRDLKTLLSHVRSVYPESYVQAAVEHAEGNLREVWKSAVRVSDYLSKQSADVNWSVEHYLRTENALKNLHIQTSFHSPTQAASVTAISHFAAGTGTADTPIHQQRIVASDTLLQQLKQLWWRFYEGLLLKKLGEYQQGDPRIRSFIQIIDIGSPAEQRYAREKLSAILHAFEEIARSQTALNVYKQFGNERNTLAAFKNAEEQRRILAGLGVSKEWYAGSVDLSKQYRSFSLSACHLNPLRDDGSSLLMEFPEMMPVFMLAMINEPYREWTFANVTGLEQQAILYRESRNGNQEERQATIGPLDPYNEVSEEDILHRDDPEVSARLKNTYWFTLSPKEQDRRYEEIRKATAKYEKEWRYKELSARTGIGNPHVAKVFDGGTNMVVQTINTASVGLAGQVVELIKGPQPEGTYNPLDNPNGKQAGEIIGNIIGFALPFKLLKTVKTPKALEKLSPTLVRSMVAEGVFSTATEVSDALHDFKHDGTQSLEERTGKVALNTIAAGAGDAAIRFAAKVVLSSYQGIRQQLQELAVPKSPQGTSGKLGTIQPREDKFIPDEVTPKEVREVGDVKVEGTGNINRTEPSLPKGGKPKGNYADEVDRGIKRQNETADLFSKNGYDIEMLDEVHGGNGHGINPESNPDYLIEGKPFDCYSPDSKTSIDNVVRALTKKTKNQSERLVLNLDDCPAEKVNELYEAILRKSNPNGDLKRLQELFIVKDGIITKLLER
ncbi:MAG: hypothetical protein K6T94_01710 [Paenibacillus sp.]|nr:hypothetical protein [Paenibacillus sp.]